MTTEDTEDRRPARVVAIDWSGAVDHSERKIWCAEFIDGEPQVPRDGRNREQVAEYLLDVARDTSEIVVGLDFAFSCPGWFVKEHQCSSAIEFWSVVEKQGEEWLRTCPHPFWGRCGRKRPQDVQPFRKTELDTKPVAGSAPKSVFQLAGPGQVGTGSLRGMPFLRKLRQGGFSVWPFDPPTTHVIIEIYPRILTGKVKKNDHKAREEFLAKAPFRDLPREWREVAASCEDAFDASVSAWKMHEEVNQLKSLKRTTDLEALLEGIIWNPMART